MFSIFYNTKRTANDPRDRQLAELADNIHEAIENINMTVHTNGAGGRCVHVPAQYQNLFFYVLSKSSIYLENIVELYVAPRDVNGFFLLITRKVDRYVELIS